MDFIQPLKYGVPLFLILIVVELAYSKNHHEHKNLYNWKDLSASFTMGLGSAFLGPLLKTVFSVVLFTFMYNLFGNEPDSHRACSLFL